MRLYSTDTGSRASVTKCFLEFGDKNFYCSYGVVLLTVLLSTGSDEAPGHMDRRTYRKSMRGIRKQNKCERRQKGQNIRKILIQVS